MHRTSFAAQSIVRPATRSQLFRDKQHIADDAHAAKETTALWLWATNHALHTRCSRWIRWSYDETTEARLTLQQRYGRQLDWGKKRN